MEYIGVNSRCFEMLIESHAQLKLSEVYGFCLARSRPTLFYTFSMYK